MLCLRNSWCELCTVTTGRGACREELLELDPGELLLAGAAVDAEGGALVFASPEELENARRAAAPVLDPEKKFCLDRRCRLAAAAASGAAAPC